MLKFGDPQSIKARDEKEFLPMDLGYSERELRDLIDSLDALPEEMTSQSYGPQKKVILQWLADCAEKRGEKQ